ncbi:unnamed protein product [Trichobilharzia regenti]|nr:unnamed protein product [Trichobilharzia regenti]
MFITVEPDDDDDVIEKSTIYSQIHVRSQSVSFPANIQSDVYQQYKSKLVNKNDYKDLSNAEGHICSTEQIDCKSSRQQVIWSVQTSASKEIVRLYCVTYIPMGFWIQLNTRLLNDTSLHEICG